MVPMRICLAGATGWAGSALAKGIAAAEDMTLVSAVSRRLAGRRLGVEGADAPVFATAAEALTIQPDVFVEFTRPDVARQNILAALAGGAHVVVGTSGLADEDYREVDAAAQAAHRGVLAVGNFAITAVLLQKFAEIAAKYVSHWEIIDYAHADKPDAPSGTARQLAGRLAQVRRPDQNVPLDAVQGERESRGAQLNGTQVHSVRLPGYMISLDVIFGMPDEKLILRHESGSGAEPYVAGALLAIRKVGGLTGLHRGLDTVMEF